MQGFTYENFQNCGVVKEKSWKKIQNPSAEDWLKQTITNTDNYVATEN